jgi:hypothetical protein
MCANIHIKIYFPYITKHHIIVIIIILSSLFTFMSETRRKATISFMIQNQNDKLCNTVTNKLSTSWSPYNCITAVLKACWVSSIILWVS